MTRAEDTLLIIQLIQAWGLWRDQGHWDRLAETFARDGIISVSWFAGLHDDFITRCRATHKKISPRSKHLIGAPFVPVGEGRALAETSVQILGRATLSGVTVDNTSYARFVDRLIRQDGIWRIAERIAIYEKDRLDPVGALAADFARLVGGVAGKAGAELRAVGAGDGDRVSAPEPARHLDHACGKERLALR